MLEIRSTPIVAMENVLSLSPIRRVTSNATNSLLEISGDSSSKSSTHRSFKIHIRWSEGNDITPDWTGQLVCYSEESKTDTEAGDALYGANSDHHSL